MSFLVSSRSGDALREEKVKTTQDAAAIWHRAFLSGSTARIVELESGIEYVMDYCELVPAVAARPTVCTRYSGSIPIPSENGSSA